MTLSKPIDQMDTAELAEAYELLASGLPAMRHLPTITLKLALKLAENTSHGVVTEEDCTRIRQLAAYSCQHAARFVETTRQMAELRQALALDAPDYKPDLTRQVHPALNYGELLALVNADRNFAAACDAFVDSNRRGISGVQAEFATLQLQRRDQDALHAAQQLAEAFPTPAPTPTPSPATAN